MCRKVVLQTDIHLIILHFVESSASPDLLLQGGAEAAWLYLQGHALGGDARPVLLPRP